MKNSVWVLGLVSLVKIEGDQPSIFAIDTEDLTAVSEHSWYLNEGYAAASSRFGGRHTILMHRLVMNAPKNRVVDHINGNRNDNRKSNLRIVGKSENAFNRPILAGVHFHKSKGKYQSYIKHNGHRRHLGYYTSEIDARERSLAELQKIDPVSALTRRKVLDDCEA